MNLQTKYLKELLARLKQINEEQTQIIESINKTLGLFSEWCVTCKGVVGGHECDNCDYCGTSPAEKVEK